MPRASAVDGAAMAAGPKAPATVDIRHRPDACQATADSAGRWFRHLPASIDGTSIQPPDDYALMTIP